MKIVFGMHLDGVVWSSQPASIGEVRTGPLGLLSILETHLGISQPSVHPVHRINEYMNRIKKIDTESIWFHKSFSVDPWSTARQLLEWRDELVEAGWQDQMPLTGSPRLDALTTLENVDIPLSAGRSDRLRKVIELLKQNHSVFITSIQLTEPLTILPPVWQYLIELLKNQGTLVSIGNKPDRSGSVSNLALIQANANGYALKESLNPIDDSLILLRAENEWEAAEHLALWLASNPDANDQVSIICGTDTSVLDQALSRHGLPRLGRSEPSRWREIQQILPLVLANAWQPVDIRLLVELLSLTSSPFPRWVCRYLLKAVSEEPGVGGDAWEEALAKIADKRKQDLVDKGDAEAEEKTRAFVQGIQSLLVEERFDPAIGIPEDKLRGRCQKVIEWLGWQLDAEPMLVEVVGQAREMQKLSIGQGSIPRIMLERMLDTVIGAGSMEEDSVEEAGMWHVVDQPGQLLDSHKELIWWGFNDPATATPTYWSDQERDSLGKAGVALEESRQYRSREAFAWQNGLLNAQKRFIAIYIAQVDGEESYHHPLWDSILCAAVQVGNSASEEVVQACLVRECKDFEHKADWEFAGRKNALEEVPETVLAPAVSCYIVPATVIKAPVRLSFSQMSTLIGCPMKWALEYYADLSLPDSQIIPTGNQMIGTFCHKIIQELYFEGKQWNADDASFEAGFLYDSLLPSMASELMLEGNAIERQRYRSSIVEAVRQLTESINRRQLKVEKTEAQLNATLDNIPFIGFADLLLRDADGHPFVLDLKWSSSSKYRRQEVEEGSSLQLAAYAWMLRSAELSEQVHTGYFMLAQGQLISDSPSLTDEAIDSPCTLEEVWNMGVASLNDVCKQLSGGLVEACGVKERMTAQADGTNEEKTRKNVAEQCRANGMLYQSPPCKFCDFSRLCGWSGGVL